PAEGGDEDHRPDVLHQIDELVPAPGRSAITGREEHAHFGNVEPEDEDIEDDDRKQEPRDRQPEERDEAEQGIRPTVLTGGGNDAERYAEQQCQKMACERQRNSRRQATGDVVDHVPDEVEDVTEIEARDDTGDP